MPGRDDFSRRTLDELAKAVRYLCSNPGCERPTLGPNAARDGLINVGVGAHITAAAPGGPRYDPSLSSEERRHRSNGIHLCQDCAKLIDSDERNFTVELLRNWKLTAETRRFHEVVDPRQAVERAAALPAQTLQAGGDAGRIGAVAAALAQAARADIDAFKRTNWPQHAVVLHLRMLDDTATKFTIADLPAGIEIAPEVTIVAAPGTGKTTTLIQLAEALSQSDEVVPLYIPLGDWATQNTTLFVSVLQRRAFNGRKQTDLDQLAEHGRLLLLLDGWNELDSPARQRLRTEMAWLRRELPHLRMVVTTRRQALDVPISGPRVEIDLLSEEQQMALARAVSGEAGARLVDEAWRSLGVRALIAIPLYLNSLLVAAPQGTLPTTKEEILRLFVAEHEGKAEHAEALAAVLRGRHMTILAELATAATRAQSTALSDQDARRAVAESLGKLHAAGQIVTPPEPDAVLSVLVDHHLLVRTGADGTLGFQHQQFQEWYASFAVEETMRVSAQGNDAARRLLRFDFLNVPDWEESILFACERVSRAMGGADIVAHVVRLSLAIDPMLAAEIIYRSDPSVWALVSNEVIAFAGRWHTAGVVDRAVRFMIMTGREEFSATVWPLVSSDDTQTLLPAMRAAPRFRPSVLGQGVAERVRGLPEQTREHFLACLALESGYDGMDLATNLAIDDPSASVKVEVIEHLLFRRADRHAVRILNVSPDEVWIALATKRYGEEIDDEAASERLRAARTQVIETDTNLVSRFVGLVDAQGSNGLATAISDAIASAEFPARDQYVGSSLVTAFRSHPQAVAQGLLRRLVARMDLPLRSEEMLAALDVVDEEALAAVVLDLGTDRWLAAAAASVVGPITIGRMLDAFLQQDADRSPEEANRYHTLRDRLTGTRTAPFVAAILARPDTQSVNDIRSICDVIALHGNDKARKLPLGIGGETREQLIQLLRRWAELVLQSPDAQRRDLNEVAQAIGRLGDHALVPELRRLLDEELTRWRRAREARAGAHARGDVQATSDAAFSYTNQYRAAFANIDGEACAQALIGYLQDRDFGFDAAAALKTIWDRQAGTPTPSLFRSWPDFSEVAETRAARLANGVLAESQPFAAAIFAAVEALMAEGRPAEDRSLAIRIARVGLGMPHGDRSPLVASLIASTTSILEKRELLAMLVLNGEVIPAAPLLEGIACWLELARQHQWMLDQSLWEIEGWLELLPFSDRPEETPAAIDRVNAALRAPRHMDRVARALGLAPGPAAEQVLAEVVRRNRTITSHFDWVGAITGRGTASAALLVVDLVAEGVLVGPRGMNDLWSTGERLVPLVRPRPELKAELIRRYDGMVAGPVRDLLEHVFSKLGDEEALLAMVQGYVRTGRGFDGTLARAIREIAFEAHPDERSTIHTLHPVALPHLRRGLFAMLTGTRNQAALAEACLNAIDTIRDQHGRPEGELRHPDIASDRAWPTEANE